MPSKKKTTTKTNGKTSAKTSSKAPARTSTKTAPKPARKTAVKAAATKTSDARKTSGRKTAPATAPAKVTARSGSAKPGAKIITATPRKAVPAGAAAKATRKPVIVAQPSSNSRNSVARDAAAEDGARKLKSPYTKTQIRPMQEALLARRARIIRDINLMGDEALREGDHEIDAESVADHGTDAYERNLTLGLMEADSRTLRQIDSALAAMDEGSYGLCEVCTQPIPLARLEALPFATTCVPCQERAEGSR